MTEGDLGSAEYNLRSSW